MSALVRTEQTGRVLEVTLADPRRRNALSLALLAELEAAFPGPGVTGVAAVVVTGADGAFSAGANLADLDGTIADLVYDRALGRVVDRIRASRLPVIAAVEGACLGAGFGLAMACDVRIASRTAFFEVPAARLGLLYDPAAVAAMRRRLPAQTLARLLVVGERLPADAAERAGVVAEVVEAGASLARARALAERAAGNVAEPVAEAKGLLAALDEPGFDLEHWSGIRARILASPERKAAVAAAKAALGRRG